MEVEPIVPNNYAWRQCCEFHKYGTLNNSNPLLCKHRPRKSDATWIAERLLCSFGKMLSCLSSLRFFTYFSRIEELGTGDFFLFFICANT